MISKEAVKLSTHSCSTFLQNIRSIVLPTIEQVLKRSGISGDWINMKIDPINGKDRNLSSWYDPDKIYSWIQGRGLETFSEYKKWDDTLKGYKLLDREKLEEVGDALYASLFQLLPRYTKDTTRLDSIPFVFSLHPENDSYVTNKETQGRTTISDLFVARGLVSYATMRGLSEDLPELITSLRTIVDCANRGELVNDQMDYHLGKPIPFNPDIIGLEGPMLAIGAALILFEATQKKEDLKRGFQAIERIFSVHTSEIAPYGKMIVDFVDPEGSPIRTDGAIDVDPGHALEIVGMALQFIRTIPKDLCDSEELLHMQDWIKDFRKIGKVLVTIGTSPLGTVYKKIQLPQGIPVDSAAPWWSSFEAIRTCCELLVVSEGSEESQMWFLQISNFFDTVLRIYMSPSTIGVPVQTVDAEGQIILLIPATPDIDPGYHTGIPLFAAYEILSHYSGLLVGMASTQIPLELGKILQGHIARIKPAEAVLDPLYVRSCCLETACTRTLFISCDILELDTKWTDSLYTMIEENFHTERTHILIAATHNHTGPCVLNLGTTFQDEDFYVALEQTIKNSVRASIMMVEPVTVSCTTDTVPNIGINRRVVDPVSKISIMKPNPLGDHDDSITTICFRTMNDLVLGVLVNVAVHPTTLGVHISKYSADYPGRIVKALEKAHSVIQVIVLQGASGDVRPAIVNAKGTDFIDGAETDIDRIGDRYAEFIEKAIKSDSSISLQVSHVETFKTKVAFPLALPSLDQLEKNKSELLIALEKISVASSKSSKQSFSAAHDNEELLVQSELAWADQQISSYAAGRQEEYISAEFALTAIGDSIVIITIPGEVFSGIGLMIKKMFPGKQVVICGYGGGSVGYIPTEKALQEGGYEVERAYRLYGLPGPFTIEVENILYQAITNLQRKISHEK